jgi:hypothetical protein
MIIQQLHNISSGLSVTNEVLFISRIFMNHFWNDYKLREFIKFMLI